MKKLPIFANVRKLFSSLNDMDRAGKYKDGQEVSIKELTLYPGYKYIIEYREIETETAMSKLTDIKTPKDEIPYWQAKCNCGVSFLSFLDDITGPRSL